MKLLLVNALYPPYDVGGAERSVALLAEALARDGAEIHVATLGRGDEEIGAVERGVTVHRLPLDQPYWPWDGTQRSPPARLGWHWRERGNRAAAARLGGLLDRLRPDLVHSHVLTGFSIAPWGEVKRRGVPLAHTLRDYSLICSRSALFRRERPCAGRCLDCRVLTEPSRIGSRMVDAVAGNSDFTLDQHRRAGRFDGVAGRRLFNIVPREEDTPRGPGEGPLRFGFLGRIETEKGIGTLLAAVPRIGREQWRLRIGGRGRNAAAYRSGTGQDKRIAWLGQVEARAFYRSIDVLVVPSLWPEPLPRTLVEAAAAGCSVIAADAGGIGEVVGVAGVSALFRAGDADGLAAAMRAAIDAPAQWRGGDGGAADLAAFTEAAVVAAHHDFYDAARRAAARAAGR